MITFEQTHLFMRREKAYKVLEDFVADENKRGNEMYLDITTPLVTPDDSTIYLGPEDPSVYLGTFGTGDPSELIFHFKLELGNLDKPVLNVHRKDYFETGLKIAENIKKEIGVEVLLEEHYKD